MTEEEFERVKEAEKERLRTQKRLRAALESLKRRGEVQSVVRRMSQGAKQLLQKTEAFADELASRAARQAARLEVATQEESEDGLSFEEAEEALRDKRAESLIRRLKAEEKQHRTASREESESPESEERQGKDGPDKTIGRMGDH